MNIDDQTQPDNLVRADSPEARKGFRLLDREICRTSMKYSYFVPMDDNSTHLYIRRTIKKERSTPIEPEHILVFHIGNNTAGIVEAGKMVEPVDMKVLVTS